MSNPRPTKTLPPHNIVSQPRAETPGKEGTLGGNLPLQARAGVQSAKAGGVLDVVLDGKQASGIDDDDVPQGQSKR